VARAGDVEVTRETLSGGIVVVRVEGELDLATCASFEGALGPAEAGGRLVIDLTECTFLDSSAVRLLVGAVRDADESGGKVSLVASDPGILRVLEIAAVDTMLPVHESLDSAL
jgi:anti-sigma B factor antagonist